MFVTVLVVRGARGTVCSTAVACGSSDGASLQLFWSRADTARGTACVWTIAPWISSRNHRSHHHTIGISKQAAEINEQRGDYEGEGKRPEPSHVC